MLSHKRFSRKLNNIDCIKNLKWELHYCLNRVAKAGKRQSFSESFEYFTCNISEVNALLFE